MDDELEFQKHQTLCDRVIDQLMNWIMNGKIQMGQKLNTDELAKKFHVSRMPIREAIKEIEKRGLVESIPYVGARLVTLTPDDIRQIYMMRKALEPLLGFYACINAMEEDIHKTENILYDFEQIVESEQPTALQIYKYNRLFHFSIYRASGLNRIYANVEHLWDNLAFFKFIYGQVYVKNLDAKDKLIQEHRNYFNLLSERKSQKLHDALQSNLENLEQKMPEIVFNDTVNAEVVSLINKQHN